MDPITWCVQIRAVLVEERLCTFQEHPDLAEDLGVSAELDSECRERWEGETGPDFDGQVGSFEAH